MKSNSFFTSRLGGANPIHYHLRSCLRFRPLSAIVVAIFVVSHLSAGYARDTARNTSNDSSSKTSAQSVLTSNEPSSKASAQPALTPNEPPSKTSAQPALITLSIQTSSPQPAAGTGLGISA